ncbi:ABC transporter substrate-binding protein [Roseinatronobacter alkalisoli]|uniref:ABC transporter substrate-binding protein n=1 Tax=Roseinatronobacter alkalisoli TaxID=3028235 RepID=A0ABT5TEF2_9RHOB|nr:ABC transporter substrate-binding protein [Roseinatronobacter sp. HJB301]MDD7973339.1 ABC transporter substrate-binding protein [Roseinatronobacter sp. HJB301]
MRKISAMPMAALLLSTSLILPGGTFANTPSDTLVYGTSLAQVISLDPHQGQEVTALEIMANLYDRLVGSGPDGTLTPQLAESWDLTDESITFHLRENATFATGEPVTADDVVWSLTRLMTLNQAPASKLQPAGYTAENIADMVHAVDERTFRIDLTGDIAADLLLYRLSEVAASVVNRATVEPHDNDGDLGNGWLRTNAAGSGPFLLSRWAPNDIVLMDARADYWNGAPQLSRVIMRHVPESQVERLMLERGDIDIAGALSAGDITYFTNSENVTIQSVPTGGFYVLAMNMERPELSDPRVREAIFRAIDHEGIEAAILGPYGRTRHVPVPVDFAHAIPDPEGWGYDPEAARTLLEEAGFGGGFSLTIKTIAQTPRVELATAVQAGLAEIGIQASVIQGSGADIVSMHRARDFDILIPQTGSYMPNVMGSMEQFSSNPDNSREANNAGNFVWRSAWDIPELTQITAEALRENDAERRGELYEQMQYQFVESVPAVFPMFERFQPIVLSNRVQGYQGHAQNVVRLENVTKTD